MVDLPQVENKVTENKSRITNSPPPHDHHHTHNKHVKAGLGIHSNSIEHDDKVSKQYYLPSSKKVFEG